jgi:anti-anti-sigma factor
MCRKPRPGIVVLEMKGSIHAAHDCTYLEDNTYVILDLTGVTHIDSAAIGSIVRCFSRARRAGGDFRLAPARGMVEGTLRLTKIDRIMGLYPTASAAADFSVAR